MELSGDLLSQFAKITKDEKKESAGITVNGTATEYEGKIYVRIDGSDQLTPIISSTAGMKNGDRVTVLIKDHSATVTGNVSSPSVGSGDLDDVKEEIGNTIAEFEIVIADKVSTKEFDTEKARIDDLVAENVTIKGDLEAANAKIGDLEADNVVINGDLEAVNGKIENLETTKLDADIADIKYATVENLEATNADIHNLEADYGEFKELTTDKFEATDAEIKRLDTEKLSAEEADIKYANIDFANIGKAAIENFFSKSGMIGDLVVGDGTITGTLVGVTIKGDLIEGGTVVADKLVIKGTDGLYYKLNTDGETVSSEQTEYNSLNGQVITAKSITAEKISVNDLVAFGATIGGFKITDSSLYSGVKESVGNTTRGIYLDDTGQFSVGDSANYLRFFEDTDGSYKLEISANSIKMGSSGKKIDEYISESVTEAAKDLNTVKDSMVYYQAGTSGTMVPTGAWTESIPTVGVGKYLWTKTVISYTNGTNTTMYSVSRNGADGKDGTNGKDGEDGNGIKSTAITYQAGSSQTTVPTGTWSKTIPKLTAALPYLWTKTVISYTNSTNSTSYSVSSTLEGIEVGGRNLQLGSRNWEATAFATGVIPTSNVTIANGELTVSENAANANTHYIDVKAGDIFSVSVDIKAETAYSGNTVLIQLYKEEKARISYEWVTGNVTTEFTRIRETFTISDQNAKYMTIGLRSNAKDSSKKYIPNTYRLLKIERGNKATDWSPAPEDLEDGINDAQASADQANDKADDNADKITETQASLDILSDSISMLVTDENGNSMMTQTGAGWTFNMGAFRETLDSAVEDLNNLSGDVSSIDGAMDKLDTLVNDLSEKTAYIVMTTDDSGAPCIELGKEGNDFRVRITNTSVDFMEGSAKIAYVSNQSLFIERAVIKDELQIGETTGFVWKRRSNGNMGLRWIGG